MPTLQVRVDNLKIEADVAVGARGNPSVANTFRNMAEVRSKRVSMQALHDKLYIARTTFGKIWSYTLAV